MSKNQRTELAARALAGLTARQPMTAQQVHTDQRVNECGIPIGCFIDTP